MAMGRGNALMAAALFCLVVVAFQSEVSHAKTYIVGDAKGWTYGAQFWPTGKSFNAGDVLVFKYLHGAHTVAVVNQAGLDSCSVIPKDAKVFTSGNDQITLVSGNNNFIDSIADHCNRGLKMTVDAV
ncbi:cupredoxin [Artemisia annua]|uniref:Basic blue protein n=1 Tax=Artemisia annua TaxID=35608 RepID=A0A2U1KV15_ARTAN|nr:cupredoxin [Artemisia annua]